MMAGFSLRKLCIAVFVTYLAVSSIAHGAPCVSVEKTTLDAGDLPFASAITAAFKFSNTGDQELVVQGVDATCDCTKATVGKSRLQPGESSTVEVKFQSAGVTGAFQKSVLLRTNDQRNPSITLQLVGQVLPVAALSPEEVDIGSVSRGTVLDKTVTVTPANSSAFKVVSVESHGKHVRIQECERIDDQKAIYVIRMKIGVGDRPGRLMEAVQINTSVDGAKLGFLVFGKILNR
ncbi:MAG: DUF1573 domain-containing protein [Armatimonadota bacterium]|nr:DUF1573 domain-containing protein [Armatimonadota bacterium]